MSIRPRKLRSIPYIPFPPEPDWPLIVQTLRQARFPMSQIAAHSCASREHLHGILQGKAIPSHRTGERLLQLYSLILKEQSS